MDWRKDLLFQLEGGVVVVATQITYHTVMVIKMILHFPIDAFPFNPCLLAYPFFKKISIFIQPTKTVSFYFFVWVDLMGSGQLVT